MRAAFAVVAALSVAGCGETQLFCSPTDNVRATVDGRDFEIPVDLKPKFLGGAAEHAPLPSYMHRDDQGRWAYCQSEYKRPAHAETISFYPRATLPEAHFIIIGRKRRYERRQPDHWPLHNEGGFEVTTTKGAILIFSPAGGVRPTPVEAGCMPGGESRHCRVDFTTHSGVNVTFDLNGARSLTEWPAIIARVDSYVRALETRR